MDAISILKRVVEKGASDLHIGVRNKPILRINGDLVIQEDLPPVTDEETRQLLVDITTPEQLQQFQKEKELDFAYSVPGLARFRVNVLLQRGTLSFAFRVVPIKIPTLDELNMPPVMKQLAAKKRGLILVTGQTGSGKSTTMAALINHINETEPRNIITIEEPVEFLHQNKKCLISQREVGSDTNSFSRALVFAMRHDPDVVVIGEMRDLATISTAITAAETGHLVLATLHTYDAPQTVDRIIDVFPPEQQPQIRIQLAQIIEAVISQTLLHKIGGGRVAALEIMLGTQATRFLIREGKSHQLHSTMQTATREGMQILDQDLARLVINRKITTEEAFLNCSNTEQLNNFLKNGVR